MNQIGCKNYLQVSFFSFFLSACGIQGSLKSTSGVDTSASYVGSGQVYVTGGNSFSGDALLGTLDNYSLSLLTNGLPRMVITSSGKVGIGTSSPLAHFELSKNDSTTMLYVTNENSTTSRYPQISARNYMGSAGSGVPQFILSNSRGDSYSSLPVLNGDPLGQFAFRGSKSTTPGASISGASIEAFAAEDFGVANGGTFMTFNTTPLGNDNLPERMRITSGGNVGIANTNPTARLEVSGQIVSNEFVVTSGNSVNFTNGNSIVLQSVGSSTINLSNMVAGGIYRVIIEDTISRTYSFTGCGTTYWSPAAGATANRTIFTIYRRSTACFVEWSTGFN